MNLQQSAYASSRSLRPSWSSSPSSAWAWGGAPAPDSLASQIDRGRRAVNSGSLAGPIAGVEARLREKSDEDLGWIISEFASGMADFDPYEEGPFEGLPAADLRDMIWTMITVDCEELGFTRVEAYLQAHWVARHLPEGLPGVGATRSRRDSGVP